jgi:NAD(P)-dependent dehydrogenase (short-subunit alcohol dehydrogenase family)
MKLSIERVLSPFGKGGRDLLGLENDVAVARDLVALDLVLPRDGLAGLRVDVFPPHAVARATVDDVEGDPVGGRGGGKEGDGAGQGAHAQVTSPDRSWCHAGLLVQSETRTVKAGVWFRPGPERRRRCRVVFGSYHRPDQNTRGQNHPMSNREHIEDATDAVETQRRIQVGIDRREDGDKSSGSESGAMQAGARAYPVPPFPEQHQPKPGDEAALMPAPMYDAPFWRGSGKLEGKVALITGGDSGIGRAVAVLFAREGADVAIAYLSEAEDAEETRLAVADEGRECLLLPGDVAEEAYCRDAVAAVIETFGRLDILVNNAAFQYHAGGLEDLTTEHFDMTLKTNLYGYFFMAREAVKHMRPGSAIINTGSVTGIRGSGELIDYSMTKGGIHAFTRARVGSSVEEEAHHRRRRVRPARVGVGAAGRVRRPRHAGRRRSSSIRSHACRRPAPRRAANGPGLTRRCMVGSEGPSPTSTSAGNDPPAFEGWTVASAVP